MIGLLKKLMGGGNAPDIAALMAEGATIVDVRTAGEYASGHVKGSVNIPLDTLGNKLNVIKKDKPVITCCASGMRSGAAKTLLLSKGFQNVHNGGSWVSLKKYE